MLIMPVANGVLPRPGGGKITGMFVAETGSEALTRNGIGQDILVCPWVTDQDSLYPVGVIARITDIAMNVVTGEGGEKLPVLVVGLEGREHGRWRTLKTVGSLLLSPDIEKLDFPKLRADYPVISGAGWIPAGGYTEFRDKDDIPVTIYGSSLETGRELKINANLGRLVEQEQAHTIEHAIIRSLRTYGLCTARTLQAASGQETEELKQSVETSMKFALPEILGVTDSGICGNPMTNMARFFLTNKLIDNLKTGKSLADSLERARRGTMSQLTQDLGITTQPGLRVLQGLKKGMSHDDSLLKLNIYRKVIGRFPFDPWG